MKFYVTKVNEQGSLVVTDTEPKVSALGIRRSPGQRYMVPSVIRAADQTGNPEVVDAARNMVDEIVATIQQQGFAVIEWAIKTDNKVIARVDGQSFETSKFWADYDMDKLDRVLQEFMQPVGAGSGGNQGNNNAGGGRFGAGAGKPNFNK